VVLSRIGIGQRFWVRRTMWIVVAVIGTVMGGTYLLSADTGIQAGCFGITAITSLTSMIIGPRLWRPRSSRAWWLMAVAAALFLVGAEIRPWSVTQPGLLAASGDLFTLSGYVSCILSLVTLARSNGRTERFALADGLTVAIGAGAIAAVIFALPAADTPGRPTWISVLAGLYPVIDVILLLVLLQLGFNIAVGTPSYMSLAMSISLLLVGDVGYAWIGAQGRLVGSRLLDLPYIASYTLFGIAALHSSMPKLQSPVRRSTQPWSTSRLALIVPALCAPPTLLLLSSHPSSIVRVIIASAAFGTLALLVVRSVTAIRSYVDAQTVLKTLITTDRLTALPNRAGIYEKITERLATMPADESAWAVSLDIDGFRMINETWGHATGDQLLVDVATRLRHAVPGNFVSRTGGDEFLILVDGGRQDALDCAEQARASVAAPFDVDGMEFSLTVSVGVASARARSAAIDLQRDADTAMGRAKAEGRDRVVAFGEGMRERVRERIELEMALRQALSRHQFKVAYQPFIDMASEQVIGCEALLRWELPERGAVPPNAFIPIAEETGLIKEIGAWVLREAARQVGLWRATGVVQDDFFVSVNCSSRQLTDPGLPELVRAVTLDSGISPANLELEITESVMLGSVDDADEALLVLARIRDLGVGLSLDDFGTGYSSLSYLSQLPVTTVKLDRSFVGPLEDVAADRSIVKAVQAIASALDLRVIAEGVETQAQQAALAQLRVPVGQGWLWGRAVSAEEFARQWGRGASSRDTVSPGAAYADSAAGKSNAQ
jgi:diguanylate cyclase (GGDEF)-like protein